MSSAILYLAIIAIWACFLVPAWVRRPHVKSGRQAETANWFGSVPDDAEAYEYEHEYDQPGAGAPDAEAQDAGRGSEADRGVLNGSLVDGPPAARERAGAAAGFAAAPVEYLTETAEYPADTENGVDAAPGTDVHAGAGRRQQDHDQAPHRMAAAEPESGHAVMTGPRTGSAAQDAAAFDEATHPRHRPSQSREQMLRARRRMLTILVTMTAVTGGFAYLGVVGLWICVPPAGMLVLYVLLLREIAMADAEIARKRHAQAVNEARAEARAEAAARRADQERAERGAAGAGRGSGPESGIAEPTAQIIDISGRVGDQLYDQYADAAVRAVGD